MVDLLNVTEDEWAEILERLTSHALGKFRKHGWARYGAERRVEEAGPGGKSPEDMAIEAIELVLDGTRKCESRNKDELLRHLQSVVDSRVYHLRNKSETQKTVRIPIRRDPDDGEVIEMDFEGHEPDLVSMFVAKEVIEQVKEVMQAEAENDPLVLQLLECFEAGITTPRELAEYLGVDVKKINNAQKRFRRTLDKRFSAERERR